MSRTTTRRPEFRLLFGYPHVALTRPDRPAPLRRASPGSPAFTTELRVSPRKCSRAGGRLTVDPAAGRALAQPARSCRPHPRRRGAAPPATRRGRARPHAGAKLAIAGTGTGDTAIATRHSTLAEVRSLIATVGLRADAIVAEGGLEAFPAPAGFALQPVRPYALGAGGRAAAAAAIFLALPSGRRRPPLRSAAAGGAPGRHGRTGAGTGDRPTRPPRPRATPNGRPFVRSRCRRRSPGHPGLPQRPFPLGQPRTRRRARAPAGRAHHGPGQDDRRIAAGAPAAPGGRGGSSRPAPGPSPSPTSPAACGRRRPARCRRGRGSCAAAPALPAKRRVRPPAAPPGRRRRSRSPRSLPGNRRGESPSARRRTSALDAPPPAGRRRPARGSPKPQPAKPVAKVARGQRREAEPVSLSAIQAAPVAPQRVVTVARPVVVAAQPPQRVVDGGAARRSRGSAPRPHRRQSPVKKAARPSTPGPVRHHARLRLADRRLRRRRRAARAAAAAERPDRARSRRRQRPGRPGGGGRQGHGADHSAAAATRCCAFPTDPDSGASGGHAPPAAPTWRRPRSCGRSAAPGPRGATARRAPAPAARCRGPC